MIVVNMDCFRIERINVFICHLDRLRMLNVMKYSIILS